MTSAVSDLKGEQAPLVSRRQFLRTALLAGAGLAITGCGPSDPLAHVRGRMINPDLATGHLLRDPSKIPAATGPLEELEVVIVGGGISGLSALRTLRIAGLENVVLLELEAQSGGNAASGSNAHSAYPWAAHYLPVPDPGNQELLDFLKECGVITGYRAGLPVYNEYCLCADPEERLFMNGYWQEGLVPATGLTNGEQAEIAAFFRKIEQFRRAVGKDGRPAFCIPLAGASRDESFLRLDAQTFAAWLDEQQFRSKPLRWYLDYCCLDDYGLKTDAVSAWAGIHYFAGRKGRAANAAHSDLLTWPEGNAFLANALRGENGSRIRSRSLVYRIDTQSTEGANLISVYDAAQQRSYLIRARHTILATPDFINRRLLGSGISGTAPAIAHTPWLVANLTVKQLSQPAAQGAGLCWDNVLYGAQSVGYVNARHQQPGVRTGPEVLTYYKPLMGIARSDVMQRDWKSWLREIVAELQAAHPELASQLQDAEIRIWGHGMAGPLPGFLTTASDIRAEAGNIELAHTDYSGISIFEEAFYGGLRAARAVLKRL